MLEIDCTVDGRRVRADLHAVRVPGINVPATSLSGPELFKACTKLGVKGVTVSHGWQDLCLRLAAFVEDKNKEAERAAEAKFAAAKRREENAGLTMEAEAAHK